MTDSMYPKRSLISSDYILSEIIVKTQVKRSHRVVLLTILLAVTRDIIVQV